MILAGTSLLFNMDTPFTDFPRNVKARFLVGEWWAPPNTPQPLTIQTGRRHPDAIIAVKERDLISDRTHQHLRRYVVRTRLVESHNGRERGGGGADGGLEFRGFEGSREWERFRNEGDRLRIKNFNEKIAMFDANHGFFFFFFFAWLAV